MFFRFGPGEEKSRALVTERIRNKDLLLGKGDRSGHCPRLVTWLASQE